MMIPMKPNLIMKAGAQQEKAEASRESGFVGALAIGDIVRTTLGPKGMDKILQTRNQQDAIQITNDGATILRSIGVDNPVAKILVDLSRVQDDEVGDGTTSVTVLACELLRAGEQLINQKIHPQTIISGWRIALDVALSALESVAEPAPNDEEVLKAKLMNVAMTTLSSKILGQNKEHFAKLCVEAAWRIRAHCNLRAVKIIKIRGKTMADSYVDDGFILEKKVGINQPASVENAKVLIANTPMDTDKIKIFGGKVKVDSIAKVAEIEQAEKSKMEAKVKAICSTGCNVFINRQLIYNYPEQLFADSGVMAIEHADFDGIERLALVLDGDIVSVFGGDTTTKPDNVKLGQCDRIEQIMLGEKMVLRFSGLQLRGACTLVLCGSSDTVLDESERCVHDALCVLTRMLAKNGDLRVVYGGGCAETLMARAVESKAELIAGKQALAMEAFAHALKQLPVIIADNAGYDSQQLITELRAAHAKGNIHAGLDMAKGTIGNMKELKIDESYLLKRQVVKSAAEAAEMILRVDETIKAAPRQRPKDKRHH